MNENPYINSEAFNSKIAMLPAAEKDRYFPKRAYGLTETQNLVLPAIKWLLGFGPRAAGRTYVLAHALIQLAIENEGHPVALFDHGLSLGVPYNIGVTRSMTPLVKRLIQSDYSNYKLQLRLIDHTLTCTGKLRDLDEQS